MNRPRFDQGIVFQDCHIACLPWASKREVDGERTYLKYPHRRAISIKKIASGAVALAALLLLARSGAAQAPALVVPGADTGRAPIPVTTRNMPNNPVRLGGVFTSGLGAPAESPGSTRRPALSDENRDWIARNCDVIALSPTDISPDTFPAICKIDKLFTPLLYVYASSLYETEHRGTVGVWKPEMQSWVLRRGNGSEVPYPEPGGHWMDFANLDWASFWTSRVNALTKQYGAFGAVAAELPLGNTFVGTDLQRYHSTYDRVEATEAWLASVRKGYPNLLIPSAIGFDLASRRPTQVQTAFGAEALSPRLWNDFFPVSDGAWCEGWIQPYWDQTPLSESLWETQMEAADRAGRLGQVFIAGAAYRNDRELEFALASFLLIAHNQGRAVFQPMPVLPGEPADAGFSLATLQREVREKPAYFRIPLGVGMQERHQMPAVGGPVWRRNFQYGDVYVNSDESRTVTVLFAGPMRRLSGQLVRKVDLPPHTGAVLLYTAGGHKAKAADPGFAPPKRGAEKPGKLHSK